MDRVRLLAGIVFFIGALLLYVSGNTHFFFSVSDNFLPSVNIYPAGFFAFAGIILLIRELMRDMNTGET